MRFFQKEYMKKAINLWLILFLLSLPRANRCQKSLKNEKLKQQMNF